MKIGKAIRLFREDAGVISYEPCWVCLWGDYMYSAPTFIGLLKVIMVEWGNEKHLV